MPGTAALVLSRMVQCEPSHTTEMTYKLYDGKEDNRMVSRAPRQVMNDHALGESGNGIISEVFRRAREQDTYNEERPG